MNVVACITVRMDSSRLPGKALVDIEGKPALERLIDRFNSVRGVNHLVVATTEDPSDDPIVQWCTENLVGFYRGSRTNVCDRIYRACKPYHPDYILRGLGDCTFVEPGLQEMMLDVVKLHKADAARVCTGPNAWPVYGSAESPYSWRAVERMCAQSSGSHAEHFGSYLDDNRAEFGVVYPIPSPGYNATYFRPYRLELDTENDLELIRRIYRELGADTEPPLWRVIELLDRWPDLAAINQNVIEKTGPLTSFDAAKRQEWIRAMDGAVVDWSGDWSWLQGRAEGEKAIWCDHGLCYLGHSRGAVLVLPDGTRIAGNAELACGCGAGRTWHASKRRAGRGKVSA